MKSDILEKNVLCLLNSDKFNLRIVQFFKDYGILAALIFVTGLFAFGVELTNLSINIDEDRAFYLPEHSLRFIAGHARWAFYVYSFLLPGLDLPFISIFIGLLSLSLAITFWLSRYECTKPSLYIFGALVVSSPIFAYQVEFIFQCGYVLISLALCIISFIIYDRNRVFSYKNIFAIFLLSFTILTYQSILFLFFGLFIIELALHDNPSLHIINSLFPTFFIMISALIVYFILHQILQLVTGIPDIGYLTTQIGWGKKPFLEIIYILKESLKNILINNRFVFQQILLLIIPLAILLYKRYNHKLYILLLTFIIITYNIFIFFMLGQEMNYRFFVYFPFMYAGIFLIAIIKSNYFSKYILFIISIYIIIFNASVNTKLLLSDQLAFQYDSHVSYRIEDELLSSFPNYSQLCDRTLVIGYLPDRRILFQINAEEAKGFGGFSLYSLAGGHPDRMLLLLGCLGINLPPVFKQSVFNINQHKDIYEKIKEMPSYPKNGFITIFNKVLIIKLSDSSNAWYSF